MILYYQYVEDNALEYASLLHCCEIWALALTAYYLVHILTLDGPT